MTRPVSKNQSHQKQSLADLHGSEYVKRFEAQQSPFRLERLVSLMDLSEEMTICDFGCGNGMLMEHVCPLVSRYVGVDFSSDFIAAANNRNCALGIKTAEFHCDEITNFCANRTASFDAAFAMDLAEHVYDEEWVDILSAIRTSLKPGGSLYLHTPNAAFFVEMLKARGIFLKQFPEHVAVRNEAQNAALLTLAGFKETKVTKLPHYNILRMLHPLSGLPIVGRYFEARIFIKATV